MIRFDDILDKLSSSYYEKDITFLKKAYVFAARAHKGQIRRSGEPYLSHPLEVTNMLADMKLDVTTLAAGLLHDVLEDTDITPMELQEAFGKETSHLVEGVTKISLFGEYSKEARKAESIRKIILAMTDDLRVIFIKLADRIHNLKTLKFLPEEKQKQIAQETLEIYAPIANRLGMGQIKAELEDLSFRYVEPEGYYKISSLVNPQRKRAERELKSIKKTLEQIMEENHIPSKILFRIKRPYSIHIKMIKQDIEFGQVCDFMALRLLTDSVKNCYSALGLVHQKWPHLPHRFRDFIAMPKPNLYQALHTTIITEKKQTIEIQFRTYDMNNIAKNGIAAHWRYKETAPQSIMKEDRRILWLRQISELYKEQKNPREFLKNLKTDLIPEEVYVFTPKGKVITLPLGATALDFAFKIHSEIGMHAANAKINQQLLPLKTILKPGDIIEILTSPEKTPRRGWLNAVFTSTARLHIKRWLNLQDNIKNTTLGKKLWENALKKYTLPPGILEENNLLRKISQGIPFRIKAIEDFYSLVGFGKVVLDKKFMENLFSVENLSDKKESVLKKVALKVTKQSRPGIQVKDIASSHINLAKCCFPIKGEPIVGYITSGKGVTIHSLRCQLIKKEILDQHRMVEASWDDASEGIYKGKLLIKSTHSPGVLAKLTAVIAQSGGNITKAEVITFANNKAEIKFALIIKDIKHLENIIKKSSGIKEVFSVERI